MFFANPPLKWAIFDLSCENQLHINYCLMQLGKVRFELLPVSHFSYFLILNPYKMAVEFSHAYKTFAII